VQAHARLPLILGAIEAAGTALDPYWIPTTEVDDAELARFDGVWLLPAAPTPAPTARSPPSGWPVLKPSPFLGTCAGFQHLVLEFARAVCGQAAVHGEEASDAVDPLIRPLRCPLVGVEQLVHPVAGTRTASILDVAPRTERFFCSFGLDPAAEEDLVAHRLLVSGRDGDGEVRLVELGDHPFFIGALFQPELSSTGTWVHPLIAAFAEAVRMRARTAVGGAPALEPRGPAATVVAGAQR
jgi:CTP synthase (UTP-ammonia lyase)